MGKVKKVRQKCRFFTRV